MQHALVRSKANKQMCLHLKHFFLANTPDLETATLNIAPERRSRVHRVSLLFPAAHAYRYMASRLWRDLSRSSEPTHMHLRYTYKITHL